jgi:hypothetical protein
VTFRHSNIFGKEGWTEKARCECGYTIHGASYNQEPTSEQTTTIVKKCVAAMRTHGEGQRRRDDLGAESRRSPR